MTDIVFDCTELYQNPIRTGIQRVVRALLQHWPSEGPKLHVARFEPRDGLRRLPRAAVELMSDRAPGAGDMPHDVLSKAIRLAASEEYESLPAEAIYFIPEIFYDQERCRFYESHVLNNNYRAAILLYDFIPIFHPSTFKLPTTLPFMHYLRLVQQIDRVAHISMRTKREYEQRVMRGRAQLNGPVLPLGGDGLPVEKQSWSPDRRGFLAIGTLDGWKNQDVITAAFKALWDEGHDTPLTLIGRAYSGVDLSWLPDPKKYPHFRWLQQATDAEIADELRKTRGTIYLPDLAGFGLPPAESLWAGIPVVTLSDMPSLDAVSHNGIVRIMRPEVSELKAAVTTLLDERRLAMLWKEAEALRIGTWEDFARATANWLSGIPAN